LYKSVHGVFIPGESCLLLKQLSYARNEKRLFNDF
jgi:hypothetical protein